MFFPAEGGADYRVCGNNYSERVIRGFRNPENEKMYRVAAKSSLYQVKDAGRHKKKRQAGLAPMKSKPKRTSI